MAVAEYSYEYRSLDVNWDFWIIQMNVEREVGKKPSYFSGTGEAVIVVFDAPLTDAEKAKLDAIMADRSVGLYPTTTIGHTVFTIKDIWDYRSILESAVGKRVKWLHFPPPLPDGTHVIELWIEGSLTVTEKRKVKDAYGGLME